MNHPDAAFSPYRYIAPMGIKDESCNHTPRRMGIGPTGRKPIGFLADVCWKCGHVMRSIKDISWQSYFWVRRFNRLRD